MIYDAHGHSHHRAIGFLSKIERYEQPKADIEVSAVGFSIPVEEEQEESAGDTPPVPENHIP